jgi:hypothetical protein
LEEMREEARESEKKEKERKRKNRETEKERRELLTFKYQRERILCDTSQLQSSITGRREKDL